MQITPNAHAYSKLGGKRLYRHADGFRKNTHPRWDDDPALGNFMVKSKATWNRPVRFAQGHLFVNLKRQVSSCAIDV
ncbi:GM16228 [Drosophila sechellia]|uniref:GM16228 n=1 Tax=Drosophila sechellia TaxID=7238 RepID=B4IMX0_DROSE|nr:GM16228 [Drosophila sechellia]